jgi:hypothetical protein
MTYEVKRTDGADEPAEDDIFLPPEVIERFVAFGTAWVDGPSWRLSKERRLWPLKPGQIDTGSKRYLGRLVRLIIPAWAEKHAATDHTSTRDRQVVGWFAGQDHNGPIVVDMEGTIWADFGDIELICMTPLENS